MCAEFRRTICTNIRAHEHVNRRPIENWYSSSQSIPSHLWFSLMLQPWKIQRQKIKEFPAHEEEDVEGEDERDRLKEEEGGSHDFCRNLVWSVLLDILDIR